VLPDKDTLPLLLPVHILAVPAVVPPTDAGVIVTVALPLTVWLQVVVVFWIPVKVTVVFALRVPVVKVKLPGPVPDRVLAVAPSL
jgi:hypothetical protein